MRTQLQVLTLCAGLMLAAQAGVVTAGAGAPTNAAGTIHVALALSDGSRLLGLPAFREVPVQTSFGAMQIPLAQIRNLTFQPDHKSIELTLANGDRLTGALTVETFKLTTVFGAVTIPAALLKTLSVSSTGGSLNVQEGLVLWFSFKRVQDEIVTDESGHNNHGRLFKGARIVDDEQRGAALELDGDAAHIRVPGSPDFALTNATLAVWVRPDSWATRENEPQVIFSTLSQRGIDGGFAIHLADDRMIGWGFRSATASEGTDASTGLAATEDGHWHFVALTFEHSEGQYISCCYLDGHKLKTDERAYQVMSYGGQIMHIGLNYDSPAADQGRNYFRQFKGRIGDLKVFNRALSTEEVAALFSNGK